MTRKNLDSGICTRDVEFRLADGDGENGDGRTLEGYAAVFSQPTDIDHLFFSFSEQIAPGAFRKTLKDRSGRIVMQFNHGYDSRTGAVPIGVFTDLHEDDTGLFVRGRLFANDSVEPVREAIAGGAITGMSFKFFVIRDEWRDAQGKLLKDDDEIDDLLFGWGDDDEDRKPLQRTIKEVKLLEAGPVVFPAYEGTSVGVRSISELSEQDRAALLGEMKTTGTLYTRKQSEPHVRDNDGSGAAPQPGTPPPAEPPGDAAPESGTSHREQSKEQKPERKAPESKAATKMATLHELRTRAAEIAQRLEEIQEEHRDAELPDEIQTEWDGLVAEQERVQKSIEKIEARLAAAIAEPQRRIDGSFAPPESSSASAARTGHETANIYDLDGIRADSYGPEDFLRRVRDNAMRAVDSAKYGARDKAKAQEHVQHLLEENDTDNKDLAKHVLLTGSEEYTRGFMKLMRYGTDVMCTQEERAALTRAQTLGTDAEGGFASPFQLDPTVIYTDAGVINPIRDIARTEMITGKEWQGIQTAGATAVRGTETTTAPDSSFTLAQPVVRTNRVQAFVPYTYEIEMSWTGLLSEITRAFVNAKANEEDSFITGDGVTGTQPGGVVGSLTGNTVETAAIGVFADEDVYAVQDALEPRWERNASWLAHKTIYHKIRQFDTSGGGMFWGSLAQGNPNTLLDYPIRKASAMSSTVAAGEKILLHGDFQNFLIVDRIGMRIELIPNLFDSANGNRPTGQRGVYAVWMNNSKILVHSAFKLLVVRTA